MAATARELGVELGERALRLATQAIKSLADRGEASAAEVAALILQHADTPEPQS